jgi:hypothetical protein
VKNARSIALSAFLLFVTAGILALVAASLPEQEPSPKRAVDRSTEVQHSDHSLKMEEAPDGCLYTVTRNGLGEPVEIVHSDACPKCAALKH